MALSCLAQAHGDGLLNQVAAIVAETARTELAAIFALAPPGDALRLGHGTGWNPGTVGVAARPVTGDLLTGASEIHRPPEVDGDTAPGPAGMDPWLEVLRAHGVHSSLHVVIPGAPTPHGLLSIHSRTPRAFDEDEIQFLHSVADLLAVSLKRRREQVQGESRLEQILDSVADIIFVKGHKSRLVWANAALRSYYNLTNDQLRDMIGAQYTAANVADEYEKADHEVFETGQVVDIPSEPIIRHDGEVRMFHTVKSPIFDEHGTVVNVVGVARDISQKLITEEALASSERDLRALFEAMTDTVFVFDRDGRYLRVAHTGGKLVFRTQEELVGRLVHEVFPRESADLVVTTIRKALDEVRTQRVEYCLELDGKRAWFDGAVSPLTSSSVFWVARDITAARVTEAQLRQSQKIESIGRLAGSVAHYFNNSLAVITGHCELLMAESAATPQARADIGAIDKAARRVIALTSQLLAFSRRQMLREAFLDLNATVSTLQPLLQRVVGADIHIELDLQTTLGVVEADPTQIEQVLLNLASNSRDAMPTGGTLRIATANASMPQVPADLAEPVASGPAVLLEVSDTGTGMERSVLERAFEPFFTTKEQGKGTGLGLATVYGVVKQSGGHVIVDSEPGRGCRFSIYLPRREPSEFAEKQGTTGAAPRRTETVLLVETDGQVRQLANRSLERAGFTVLACAGPSEALECGRQHGAAIDMIVTEGAMPLMNGWQMIELLRPHCTRARFLFTSGYSDSQSASHVTLDPDIQILQKPYLPSDLVSRVRQVLDEGGTGF